jgi:hypothetical protein
VDTEAVAAMLRRDRAEWEALVAVIEAHPEQPLHGEGSPSWVSRDVYAHLARWIGRSTDDLEARLAGRALPPLAGTDDEINARWQREDSALSLADAREQAREAFERRIRAIESVPPGRWDPVLEAVANADGAEHYANHRRYISVSQKEGDRP